MKSHPSQTHAGFSLLEILVVIAIMAIILSMAVPMVGSIMRAAEVSSSADLVVSAINAARQAAILKNRNVEVRLYRYAHRFTGEDAYQAIQSFIEDDHGWEPLGRVQTLPDSVIFDETSALIQNRSDTLSQGVVRIPQRGTDYQQIHFTFRPDGSADLSSASEQWLLVHSVKDPTKEDGLPKDFFLIQLLPRWGEVRPYGR